MLWWAGWTEDLKILIKIKNHKNNGIIESPRWILWCLKWIDEMLKLQIKQSKEYISLNKPKYMQVRIAFLVTQNPESYRKILL